MNANVYANLIIVYHPYFLKTEHLIIYNLGMEIISQHIYVLIDKHFGTIIPFK
jgi:hypothetical protein